jgi:hypothetical protein
MENLYINQYSDEINYPIIDFKAESGICDIIGESYMEDSYVFYKPVMQWIHDYFVEKKSMVLNIKLVYFNTSSSRMILEILDIIKTYIEKGNSITINWYYKKEDPDMLKEIADFKEETELEINILTFK